MLKSRRVSKRRVVRLSFPRKDHFSENHQHLVLERKLNQWFVAGVQYVSSRKLNLVDNVTQQSVNISELVWSTLCFAFLAKISTVSEKWFFLGSLGVLPGQALARGVGASLCHHGRAVIVLVGQDKVGQESENLRKTLKRPVSHSGLILLLHFLK